MSSPLPSLPTLGERLRWAREKAGQGSARLSIDAGLSHAAVSRLESREDAGIEALTAFRLADLLGVDARWLVCGDKDPKELIAGARARSAGRRAIGDGSTVRTATWSPSAHPKLSR
jgi:transcriptional regulator with XRE-family HTH domain